MVSDGQLINELLALVDSTPLTKVDFAPLLEKYSNGLDFNEQRQVRGAFRRCLLDLKKNEDIDYYDTEINISVSSGGIWSGHGGLIKSTLKRKEKLEQIERDKKNNAIYYTDNSIKAGGDIIGSSVTGGINKSKIDKAFNQEEVRSREISQNATNAPAEKEKQQNAIVSFILKFWWVVIIPFLIGLALIAVEYKWFK